MAFLHRFTVAMYDVCMAIGVNRVTQDNFYQVINDTPCISTQCTLIMASMQENLTSEFVIR